ncbi:MAG: hypothetical protein M3Y04_09460 [Actinomycetota bacterium]|nr:hypothetical protein [Actinomycetota bacterium]
MCRRTVGGEPRARTVGGEPRGRTVGGEPRGRTVDEKGGGPISTWFGFSVFLVLLLFATQITFNLYATSVVTAVSYDAARRVAAGDGGSVLTAQAEADARQALGRYASRVTFDWSATTGDEVVLRVEADNPNMLLPVVAGRAAFDHVDRTVRVRVERFR